MKVLKKIMDADENGALLYWVLMALYLKVTEVQTQEPLKT